MIYVEMFYGTPRYGTKTHKCVAARHLPNANAVLSVRIGAADSAIMMCADCASSLQMVLENSLANYEERRGTNAT